MISYLAKIFTSIIAELIAYRLLATIVGIIIGFLIYKYITDPKYVINLFENIRNIFGSSSELAVSSETEGLKETVGSLLK